MPNMRVARLMAAAVLWQLPSSGIPRVFQPALSQILDSVTIPVLLPTTLPTPIRTAKIGEGTVSRTGYLIELFYDRDCGYACFAAGFAGSTALLADSEIVRGRHVTLDRGSVAMFLPRSCVGSCAPSNLWWVSNGVQYQIQARLDSRLTEAEQLRALVAMANSVVVATRPKR